ncbi:MAG: hypothetical protein DRI61_17175 [Chloroflexi bacterium]|nr:MAG: hypothetical protein DRI61_17175 [Chloroflexota bacterium]
MKNADKVETWVCEKGGKKVKITLAFKEESMGYHSDYKRKPVLYVRVITDDDKIEVRKFTGKNIETFVNSLKSREWCYCIR